MSNIPSEEGVPFYADLGVIVLKVTRRTCNAKNGERYSVAPPISIMKTKLKTIDEVCNQPPGTFRKFIERQEEILINIERERKERIRRSREKNI